MAKQKLPSETCQKCQKEITARATAHVIDGVMIVCSRCRSAIESARAERERQQQRRDEPASERQIQYASDLELAVPMGATWQEMHDILSRHLDHDGDDDAPPWLKSYGAQHGFPVTRYSGARQLFTFLGRLFADQGRPSLAYWFVFNVAREFAPRAGHVADEVVSSVAAEMAVDQKLMKSVERYEPEDLRDFGRSTDREGWVREGGSQKSAVYKFVSERLRARSQPA